MINAQENVQLLILWLGIDGAKAGLEKSEMTNTELLDLLGELIPKNSSKLKRTEIIDEIISATRRKNQIPVNTLIDLSKDELSDYFHRQKYDKKEILGILEELDIRPGSLAKRNLIDFAISEISDIGMYKRVAKGHHE